MISIFGFLKKYPLLGIILCLGLMASVTWPKVIEEGRMNGYFGEAQIIHATPVKRYTEEYTYRGNRETACMVEIEVEGTTHKVRVTCEDWGSPDRSAFVPVMRMHDGTIQAVSFMRGHFSIDLALFFIELLGAAYFTFRFLNRNAQPETPKDRTKR